jgi:hypothetical protein
MRFLIRVVWDIEKGNKLARKGKLGDIAKDILEDIEPECAYFVTEDGCRSCIMVVHLEDASELPAIAEPWFLAVNAKVEAQPAMVAEDLMKAGPAMEAAARKFG